MPPSDVIRVLIVDDHPLMRSGISAELATQPDMRVVGEAANGQEAIEAFRQFRPDVTLMDIRMPELGGIEAIREIRKHFTHARFIILTTSAGDIHARRAFQAGAAGYLLKNLLRTELAETIRQVHAGAKRIPPEIALEIAAHVDDDAISPRELEVLRAIAAGSSNKVIASELGLSEHTVKNHIKSIFGKLGTGDRTEAAMIGIRRGYIEM